MEKIEEVKGIPSMLTECKCGHPFEEHDWGAYNNPETEWAPACLVEDCECGSFEPKLIDSR